MRAENGENPFFTTKPPKMRASDEDPHSRQSRVGREKESCTTWQSQSHEIILSF
jgi:hypothetical protein